MNEVAKEVKEKVINMVTMVDGTKRNFGERGRLLSSSEITKNGFSITFHVVTGEQVTFTYSQEADLPEIVAEMAAFGVAAKVKAATAGTETKDLVTVITAKKSEIEDGIFSTRGAAGEIVTPLNQLQTAYAIANGIDVSGKDGIAQVNAVFAELSKEDKSALYKVPAIKLELAKLRLQAAQAELEGVE